MRPLFGAAPLKLNPTTEKPARMSGSLKRRLSVCWAIFVVYSRDAPGGAWMTVMK